MDFYNFVDMAKRGFDTAVQKTETAVNISKQRLDQASLESKLSKSYEILGKYCYDAIIHNGDVDGDSVKPIIDDIAEKISQIEDIKREIINARNKKVCKECGTEMDKEAAFCSKCGSKG